MGKKYERIWLSSKMDKAVDPGNCIYAYTDSRILRGADTVYRSESRYTYAIGGNCKDSKYRGIQYNWRNLYIGWAATCAGER